MTHITQRLKVDSDSMGECVGFQLLYCSILHKNKLEETIVTDTLRADLSSHWLQWFCAGLRGSWSQSRLTLVTEVTHRDKLPHTLKFTPSGNLESPVNLE